MLNIISRSLVSSHTRGPRKVVINLIKGLDEIGYPYVLNAALDATDTLWIHDDKKALETTLSLPGSRSIIAGPNIYTLPSEIPNSVLRSTTLFIHPAPWVQDFWDTFSPEKINSVVWSVGIDTEVFTPSNKARDLVLVYNKQRPGKDVEAVCAALEARGERFAVLTYGNYHEDEYRKLLAQAKAMVWVGRSESQGIGLLEAFAMNVPVLIWDITKFGDWAGSGHNNFTSAQLAFTPVTSAPYFDKRCGLRFKESIELRDNLDIFLTSLTTYSPRAYIEAELSLAKQATAFINLYKKHFNKTDSELKTTNLKSDKQWVNATSYFKCLTRLKDAVRQIIR